MVVVAGAALAACGPKRPPADFAPDPGLAARIRSVRIVPTTSAACPGQVISATYYAVLDDGSETPFSTRYDPDEPPPLHVIMLRRTSPDASARQNGDWDTYGDPLQSAMAGFRLSAHLKVKPSANGFVSVDPEYSCMRHVFEFRGASGPRGRPGAPGPDVTVRIAMLSSPFYQSLIVSAVQVGAAPPFYVMADGDYVPPADWLNVASIGGAGGRGVAGRNGADGADGEPGCPGSPGGAGGAGGNGGPGGVGGAGGRISVIAPQDEPFLAGLADIQSIPGPGGEGGKPGVGGTGGKGGDARDPSDRRCRPGSSGAAGADGKPGGDGPPGPQSGPSQASVTPLESVFGSRIPLALRELLDYTLGTN